MPRQCLTNGTPRRLLLWERTGRSEYDAGDFRLAVREKGHAGRGLCGARSFTYRSWGLYRAQRGLEELLKERGPWKETPGGGLRWNRGNQSEQTNGRKIGRLAMATLKC
uniref:Uncharacterized protein n=1 Tax=Naja naja TaxID=35670 RepID=A0A8C6XEZ4_NAJNA